MIQALANRLNMLNGQIVHICIQHILYGSQKIKCALRPLWDGERIGFILHNEEKYMRVDEIRDVSINDTECCLKSDVMVLSINY